MNDLQVKIKGRIQAAQRVLVTSHVRPDGDAIGSSLALSLALLEAGKQVQTVLSDGIPDNFKHLPGADLVCTRADGKFDLIISVDCSDLQRIGDAINGYHIPDIVIDHHITTEPFGLLNLVEPEAVATASVLTRHLQEWGLAITKPIAANLITGIITDTLGFRTSNVTSETLRQAADLLDLGADMSTLYFQGLVRRTFPAAKYWGAGLIKLQRADGIIWTTLTIDERKSSGYIGNDDADLINILSSIDEAEIVIMFVEQNENKTKVSWRGLKPHVDVSSLAIRFNGGGHKAAAGAEVSGSLADVQERVLSAARAALH
jgi:bifunctional oligoribonuclease and PAP phosphatase NrnA